MQILRKSEERGRADHGWLDARYTFSFAGYHDPAHVHFGPLRVLNQDRIAGGGGFPPHPHDHMEIVTFVLKGSLEHQDSMGNGSVILPGEVQLMSAGTGVTHSEKNGSKTEELELLQMWVFPKSKSTVPGYGQKEFPKEERRGKLRLVISPDGSDGSLVIGQDARLYTGLFADGEEDTLTLAQGRSAWIHVARGQVVVNDQPLGPGDGLGVRDESRLTIQGVDDAELVLWDFGVSELR